MYGGRPSKEVQKERVARLRDLHETKKKKYMLRQLGRELDVIVEEEMGTTAVGTTGNYLKVACSFISDCRRGSIVDVRVKGISGSMLEGDVVRRS
jgi:tRNA A37 methylthiotransferase MiaB